MTFKKALSVVCAVAIMALTLTACSGNSLDNGIDNINLHQTEIFTYDATKSTNLRHLFADNDILYIADSSFMTSENILLMSYSPDGNLIEEKELDVSVKIQACDVYNGKLYIVTEERNRENNGLLISEIDLQTAERRIIYEFDEISSVSRLYMADGFAYVLGINEDFADKECGGYTNSIGIFVEHSYNGKTVCKIDLESKAVSYVGIEFPVSMCEYSGVLYVSDYEPGDGYYLTKYDTRTESITGRVSTGDHCFSSYAVYNADGDFVYPGGDNQGRLLSSNADNPAEEVQLAENMTIATFTNSFFVDDKYIYADAATSIYDVGSRIHRISIESIPERTETIRMISNQYIVSMPFGAGYSVQSEQLSDDGFSVKVLSLDKDFDVVLVSSEQSFSASMRDMGGYYPLNEVPGVKEYLDSCHEYIKEAATLDDGTVWMLPVQLDTNCFIYNSANCENAGLEIGEGMTLGQLMGSVKKAEETSPELYALSNYNLIRGSLYSYIYSNESFDTPYFRETAPLLRESLNYRGNILISPFSLYIKEYSEAAFGMYFGSDITADKVLFADTRYSAEQTFWLFNDENVRACALPTENGRSNAICTYICVNPYSDNLKTVLGYISSIARSLSDDERNLMLAKPSFDNQYYMDLYNIYENACISFGVSGDIFSNDFSSYTSGGMTLDEFISEADRKLDIYLNE